MPSRVKGTLQDSGRESPPVKSAPRKRIRLVSANSMRRGNQGAPNSASMNIYPFPFQGMWDPAHHGHHPVFGAGMHRRVGAWRGSVGLGVPKSKRNPL